MAGSRARGVIFDLDGLLVDSEPVWERAIAETLAAHGFAYDAAIAFEHRGMRLADCVAHMVRAHGVPVPPERFGAELVDALLRRFTELAPMPGAATALALAGAHKTALASGSPLVVIDAALAACGWAGRFDAVCSGDETARGKPAPDVFLLAAERMGCAPADCVVLEDSANGIAAAKAAGMRCIAVPAPDTDAAALGADEVLASLADLRALFDRI